MQTEKHIVNKIEDTLQAEPFLMVHMLCTEKRLCANRVKFLLSMVRALLRYSFEPRPDRPGIVNRGQKRVVVKNVGVCILPLATFRSQIPVKVKYEELR